MKPIILVPIIVGSLLLTGGAVGLGIAIANQSKQANMETHEYAVEEFADFDIQAGTADFTFIATTDGTRKVETIETKKERHTVEVKDNTLQIRYVDERQWHEKTFSNANLKVNVYIPAATYGNFNMKLSTGDTVIPKDFKFNSVSFTASTGKVTSECTVLEDASYTTSTGSINLSNFSAKNLTLKATTGKIKLESLNITENIVINLDTGDLSVIKVRCDDYSSTSSTGSVTLKDTLVTRNIRIETTTGDVKFDESDGETDYIKTSTGNIKGVLLYHHHYIVRKSTGKAHYPEEDEGPKCTIETSTGDVDITSLALK